MLLTLLQQPHRAPITHPRTPHMCPTHSLHTCVHTLQAAERERLLTSLQQHRTMPGPDALVALDSVGAGATSVNGLVKTGQVRAWVAGRGVQGKGVQVGGVAGGTAYSCPACLSSRSPHSCSHLPYLPLATSLFHRAASGAPAPPTHHHHPLGLQVQLQPTPPPTIQPPAPHNVRAKPPPLLLPPETTVSFTVHGAPDGDIGLGRHLTHGASHPDLEIWVPMPPLPPDTIVSLTVRSPRARGMMPRERWLHTLSEYTRVCVITLISGRGYLP